MPKFRKIDSFPSPNLTLLNLKIAKGVKGESTNRLVQSFYSVSFMNPNEELSPKKMENILLVRYLLITDHTNFTDISC